MRRDGNGFVPAVQSLDNDLREEVYQPIEKWHFRYREVKVNEHRCNHLHAYPVRVGRRASA